MGLLAPAFLLGALAVALPLYLHLLRHKRSTERPFSSLMFFESRPQRAMRRRRLRYLALLALRLSVLVLLALAFAEPYWRLLGARAGPEPLLLVALDHSLSMRAADHLEGARRDALALIAGRSAEQRAQVLALGGEVSVLTAASRDRRSLEAAVRSIAPTDARASLGALAAAVRTLGENERAPIELHLFSDLQNSSLPASSSELALPRSVRLVLHRQGAVALGNWTVESVAAPAEVWDARALTVQAVVAGYGTPAATREVSLWINGRSVATQRVAVPPSGRAVVEFHGIEVPHGASRCSVRIDSADALPADDEYRFAIERSDPQHGLLVHEQSDERSPRYLSAALRAASEAAVRLEQATPFEASERDWSSYGFIVLDDLARLPAGLDERLGDYVRRGGSVLVVLGTAAAQQRRVPILGLPLIGVRAYSREAQRFAIAGEADPGDPVVGPRPPWERVKFYYAALVDPAGAHVGLWLADRTPMLLEKTSGEGRVLVWASGLDNLTNDLPLHPLFVAFIDRAVRELSGTQLARSAYTVGEWLPLRSARERSTSVELIDPLGRRPLSLSDSTSAVAYPLEHAGFYELRAASGRRALIAVNPDRRESDLRPIPPDVLALWSAGGAAAAPTPGPAAAQAPVALEAVRSERSLWWYAIALVLAAALLESALASRYLGTPREQP